MFRAVVLGYDDKLRGPQYHLQQLFKALEKNARTHCNPFSFYNSLPEWRKGRENIQQDANDFLMYILAERLDHPAPLPNIKPLMQFTIKQQLFKGCLVCKTPTLEGPPLLSWDYMINHFGNSGSLQQAVLLQACGGPTFARIQRFANQCTDACNVQLDEQHPGKQPSWERYTQVTTPIKLCVTLCR
jgi:hypothetical protein